MQYVGGAVAVDSSVGMFHSELILYWLTIECAAVNASACMVRVVLNLYWGNHTTFRNTGVCSGCYSVPILCSLRIGLPLEYAVASTSRADISNLILYSVVSTCSNNGCDAYNGNALMLIISAYLLWRYYDHRNMLTDLKSALIFRL